MAENFGPARTSTSTQIRNMYSEGMSYMNIKFFNTNLSFQLYPFQQKTPDGRSHYDMKAGQQTTVNVEGAYALFQISKDIIDGKITETNMTIPCAAGATLTIERKLGINGVMETIFTIQKNNKTIPFKFQTIQHQVKENGQITTKTLEIGLGAFMKTIEGYLTGINADRHLDKLTEDYAKLMESQGQGQPQQQGGQQQYPPRNNFKKPYGQNGGYRGQYGGRGGYPQQQRGQQQGGWPQQNMSNYTMPN